MTIIKLKDKKTEKDRTYSAGSVFKDPVGTLYILSRIDALSVEHFIFQLIVISNNDSYLIDKYRIKGSSPHCKFTLNELIKTFKVTLIPINITITEN